MRNEESTLIVILIAVLVASVMLSFRRAPRAPKPTRVEDRLFLSRI